MKIDEDAYLAHYGILRRSGRYPWGSGGNLSDATRNKMFLDYVKDLRKEGLSYTEIAQGFGMTTTQFRAINSIAKNQHKAAQIARLRRLDEKGYSNVKIGEIMGVGESYVRSLRAAANKGSVDVLQTTADMLREQVEKKQYIDVGRGVENQLGVSNTKLGTAVAILKEEGYEVHPVKIPQLGTGKFTELKVLAPPGTTQKDVWLNRSKIKQIEDYSEDGGRTWLGIVDPISVDSNRIKVRYAEEGGNKADGVIYVRPGVDDLSLGNSHYAQVRIAVDGTHFLKGMAMYKDDLPSGVDLVFNTSKSDTGNKLDAMKPFKKDKLTGEVDTDNPFGAVVRQLPKLDANGVPIKNTVRSAMNIVNEEADWEKWSRTLSSQMLSKQSPTLAKQQLDMAYERSRNELNAIKELTNPAVRRKMLESFADGADASSWHLKAANLPRQANKVLLPLESMKETEVYAPTFNNGERVVLIRFPHGGVFEIPELTVNNRNREGKRSIGPDAKSAIGINPKVAERLSGADFDGDTVLVIPNNNRQVKTAPALKRLQDFDPRAEYPKYDGMKVMSAKTKGIEMGKVSNLITDMTIRGAPFSEIARAVQHSMVVIDAEKHELNYRQSAIDNGIAALQKKYQTPYRESGKPGAATLISKRKSEVDVPERIPRPAKDGGPIDPVTGRKVYVSTGATTQKTTVNKKTGETTTKTVPKTVKVRILEDVDDAHKLTSGTKMESIYATHSNRMKALANEARKEQVATKSAPYNKSAKEAFSAEVKSLDHKLDVALKNAPRERQAQIIANATFQMKRQANPDADESQIKRLKYQALEEARTRTGARKTRIEISPSEWQAIQSGAITNHKLEQILNNTDLDKVKELATPRTKLLMTPAKTNRAKQMAASGYTQAEIASHLGVSLTTLKEAL